MSSCEPNRTRCYSDKINCLATNSSKLELQKIAQSLFIGFGSDKNWTIIWMTRCVNKATTTRTRPNLRILDDYHEFFIIGLVLVFCLPFEWIWLNMPLMSVLQLLFTQEVGHYKKKVELLFKDHQYHVDNSWPISSIQQKKIWLLI